MGRSGGSRKILKKEVMSRGRLFNADKYNAPKENVNERDELILIGSELWAEDPSYLLDPEKALQRWQSLNPGYDGEKNDQSFWVGVKEVFIEEIEGGDSVDGPFFRGQNGMLDHPFDRPRSWSRDIKTALGFAQTHPVISGPEGDRDCPSLDEILSGDVEIRLQNGEEVIVSVYRVEGGVGIDLNNANRDRYRDSIIDKIKNGGSLFLKYKNENGKWGTEVLNNEGFRTHALVQAVKEFGHEHTARALGLGSVSSDKMREWVLSLDSKRFHVFLERLGSESIRNEFLLKERQAIDFVLNQDFVAETNYYPNEEEVILSPNGIGRIRRFDVPVLNESDIVTGISDSEIEKRFSDGLKKSVGSNPKEVGVGQRTLF